MRMQNIYLQSKNPINTVRNCHSFWWFDNICVIGVVGGLVICSTNNLTRASLSSSETVCCQFTIKFTAILPVVTIAIAMIITIAYISIYNYSCLAIAISIANAIDITYL